jgi:hypothetical protein
MHTADSSRSITILSIYDLDEERESPSESCKRRGGQQSVWDSFAENSNVTVTAIETWLEEHASSS